jgi:hypothetical protein
LLCALSLLVEEKRRRGELAMYVLPKGLESAWVMARGKGWVFRTGEFGEVVVSGRHALLLAEHCIDAALSSSLAHRNWNGHGYGTSDFIVSWYFTEFRHHLTVHLSGRILPSLSAVFPAHRLPQNDPQHLSGLVRRILYQFIGPN